MIRSNWVLVGFVFAVACTAGTTPQLDTGVDPGIDARIDVRTDTSTASDTRIDTNVAADTRVDARPNDQGVRDTGTRDAASEVGAPDGAFGAFPTSAGQVVFTELMANPDVTTDDVGEWYELYNPGSVALDLQSCAIADAAENTHVIANTLMIPAGGYITIASSAAPGFVPTYVDERMQLNNSNETLTITCGGVVIDRVMYTTSATGASRSLSSIHLNAVDNDTNGNWCLGTAVYNARVRSDGGVADAGALHSSVTDAASGDANLDDADLDAEPSDAAVVDASVVDAQLPQGNGDRGTPNGANPNCD